MPTKNRFAELLPEIVAWRHDFHAHPELQYDVHRTATRVAELLRDFGVDEVHEGIGRTGVVGVLHGRSNSNDRVIGLRADMDALPTRFRPCRSRWLLQRSLCRRSGRRRGKRGGDDAAHRSWSIRSGLQQPVHRARGGCCGATWILCSVGQPCLNLCNLGPWGCSRGAFRLCFDRSAERLGPG